MTYIKVKFENHKVPNEKNHKVPNEKYHKVPNEISETPLLIYESL